MVRSLAFKIRKRREALATVASKVCSRSPILRRCRGQHPLAEVAVAAVMLAAVALVAAVAPVAVAAVAAAMVMAASVKFYPYDFQKYITNEDKLTHRMAADIVAGVRSRSDLPDADAASSRVGCG
jgi:MFS superfamily sulfate permease-like transporter